MTKLTLNVDEETSSSIGQLPRAVSASMLVRVMFRAITLNEKEFEKYKAHSAEAQAVRAYLRDKTRLGNIKSLVM